MNVRRFVYYLVYVVVMIWLIAEGITYLHIMYTAAQETQVLYPYFFYSIAFPIVLGLLLGIEVYITRRKKEGQWKIDWIKLLTFGIPLLYVTLLPTLSFLLQSVAFPFTGYLIFSAQDKLPLLTGLIFGYIVVDSVQKELEK
ncbi:hypothetical protein [Aneurinibacillus sp. REN35]|uniref:hypothetical protein n=1 Tax=Aneurinibacillus sp. REN35 TaxID=3237286 RepID=UPI003529CD55